MVAVKTYKNKNINSQVAVAQAFNTSTYEVEAGESLNIRTAWYTKFVPGHPRLYRETLS